ncbi:MAG: sporulation protein YjcZ [Bacilli bacterium]|nr:sporulation protein YjcZ [Bacilli bacterium]
MFMNTGCGCNNIIGNNTGGVGGAAFALVLFILLVIILGAFI